VNVLFIGDVFGGPGRRALRRHLPDLVREREVEFVVANAENLAGGSGLAAEPVAELFRAGVHCLTGGNHTWDKAEARAIVEKDPRVLRPANYPEPCPGSGLFLGRSEAGFPVAVLNLMGRVFMPPVDEPFRAADELLARVPEETKIILVDVHAEATSEKTALGRYLDGRVTAVLGTHTHVQTADARVLPGGTAYLTDVGMTGPYESVIGMDSGPVLERFLSGRPVRFKPAKKGAGLRAALVETDPASGRAVAIERIALGEGGR
jgi:metallophosphoesterase (TIGR00282 family)